MRNVGQPLISMLHDVQQGPFFYCYSKSLIQQKLLKALNASPPGLRLRIATQQEWRPQRLLQIMALLDAQPWRSVVCCGPAIPA